MSGRVSHSLVEQRNRKCLVSGFANNAKHYSDEFRKLFGNGYAGRLYCDFKSSFCYCESDSGPTCNYRKRTHYFLSGRKCHSNIEQCIGKCLVFGRTNNAKYNGNEFRKLFCDGYPKRMHFYFYSGFSNSESNSGATDSNSKRAYYFLSGRICHSYIKQCIGKCLVSGFANNAKHYSNEFRKLFCDGYTVRMHIHFNSGFCDCESGSGPTVD